MVYYHANKWLPLNHTPNQMNPDYSLETAVFRLIVGEVLTPDSVG
jgi:hypothetical protein